MVTVVSIDKKKKSKLWISVHASESVWSSREGFEGTHYAPLVDRWFMCWKYHKRVSPICISSQQFLDGQKGGEAFISRGRQSDICLRKFLVGEQMPRALRRVLWRQDLGTHLPLASEQRHLPFHLRKVCWLQHGVHAVSIKSFIRRGGRLLRCDLWVCFCLYHPRFVFLQI